MTRTLLTGGSGFIAGHVLACLLKNGHSVVTTVRSQEKADRIKEAYPDTPQSELDFVIVEDIAKPDAFDEAVKSDPPFEAVIHTASPFHYDVKDVEKDFLDPAVIGTTAILKAIKASAPTVKRVVITSSFAAINDSRKGLRPDHTYSEKDWAPWTRQDALDDKANAYKTSKTLAEQAAWEFIEDEKPDFTLATMCPPLVFGPIVHHLNDLKSLNTSNQAIRNFMQGLAKEEIPQPATYIWVDVRDLAFAHVRAMELPEAANKRFFVVADYFSNREAIEIIRKNFPEYASKLPPATIKGGELPEKIFKIDGSQVEKVLGVKHHKLEDTIVDLAKSLQALGI